MRIAVIGLYNSGSTAVAGALHRLGVNMSAPFHLNYFEPRELKEKLCEWWDEPKMRETESKKTRVAYLRKWIKRQEALGHSQVGAKHPLFCLSAYDLEEAWGQKVKYIWSHRSLRESIRGLEKRGWFSHPKFVQEHLWVAATEFFEGHQHLQVDYNEMVTKPKATIERIIDYLELEPTQAQIKAAVQGIHNRPDLNKSSR